MRFKQSIHSWFLCINNIIILIFLTNNMPSFWTKNAGSESCFEINNTKTWTWTNKQKFAKLSFVEAGKMFVVAYQSLVMCSSLPKRFSHCKEHSVGLELLCYAPHLYHDHCRIQLSKNIQNAVVNSGNR